MVQAALLINHSLALEKQAAGGVHSKKNGVVRCSYQATPDSGSGASGDNINAPPDGEEGMPDGLCVGARRSPGENPAAYPGYLSEQMRILCKRACNSILHYRFLGRFGWPLEVSRISRRGSSEYTRSRSSGLKTFLEIRGLAMHILKCGLP